MSSTSVWLRAPSTRISPPAVSAMPPLAATLPVPAAIQRLPDVESRRTDRMDSVGLHVLVNTQSPCAEMTIELPSPCVAASMTVESGRTPRRRRHRYRSAIEPELVRALWIVLTAISRSLMPCPAISVAGRPPRPAVLLRQTVDDAGSAQRHLAERTFQVQVIRFFLRRIEDTRADQARVDASARHWST